MSQKKMANRKAHVEFNDRIVDVTEYIPEQEQFEPLRTATSSESIDNRNVFFDEIALLKRHMIPRNASLKVRKMAVPQKAVSCDQHPISLEELKKRGIVLENGKIVHNLATPNSSSASSVSSNSPIKCSRTLNTRSSISRASTVQSRVSMFEAAVNEQTYKVGLPCENARLKVCELKKGERLELTIEGHGVCAVEVSDKQSTLLSYKD